MGRTLTVSVHSAANLANADADEGGLSDPYILVSFDGQVDKELARTATVENSLDPKWDETFEIDISTHMKNSVADGGEEPKMITFSIYDGDAGEAEPIGIAGLSFTELLKSGSIEERELSVYQGTGSVTVSASLKKVKKSSMFNENAALKIAGGVAGVAALGALGGYLFTRYKKKKEKLAEAEAEVEEAEGAVTGRTGMAYGLLEDSDEEDEEIRGETKKWWEMDDEEEDDEDDKFGDDFD